ncbi:S-adenosyl-L-methionine-dependent methyltransferase [Hypoxylon sp. NC0597]|nr:S-adenosyl-L-methionine-dependent methyltransferase [Hypoxylon sp. NC0597]
MDSNFFERLDSYISPIEGLTHAIWAFCIVCWNAVQSRGLSALLEVARLRSEAFAFWDRKMDSDFEDPENGTSISDLVASAEGTILEPGPGFGINLPLYNQAKVKHIYGVEINEFLIPDLQAKVAEFGLREKYTIIRSGVEDTDVLEKHGIQPGSIDAILCIQVLCSVARPQAIARELYRLLKPGGKLIFWEHTQSNDYATRIAQNLWSIPWRVFVGGCDMNRDVLRIIMSAGVWEGVGSIERDEEAPWDLMPIILGTLIKP